MPNIFSIAAQKLEFLCEILGSMADVLSVNCLLTCSKMKILYKKTDIKAAFLYEAFCSDPSLTPFTGQCWTLCNMQFTCMTSTMSSLTTCSS